MDLISKVSEELAYYIHAEKKACLPGFGCFEAVHQSAVLDPSTNLLTAPSETIIFGTAKKEDNNFVQYLTEQFSSTDIYESFQTKIIDLLVSDSKVALPGLGNFSANQKGEIAFEHVEDDEFSFDLEDLTLKYVPTVEDPTENVAINAPRAATVSAQKSKGEGMSFLRIAMLAIVSALCLSVFLNQDVNKAVQAKPESKLVNNKHNNINVSPKANQDEVYIAAESSIGLSERLEEEERTEIIKRQDAMTAPISMTETMHNAEIITNTFGSRDNAERQIEQIEALGYRSAKLENGSDLISTVIVVDYTDVAELTSILEKIKQDFPRAKVNK